MMAGMDDKEDLGDTITLEAMSGLSRILAEIDEAHIRAILINIALRIRPCFEKVYNSRHDQIRKFMPFLSRDTLLLCHFLAKVLCCYAMS